MKTIISILLVLIGALQYKVWFSDVGRLQAQQLQQEVQQQQQRTDELTQANQQLVAEVLALRAGTEAIESRARTDLGMIKRGEEYYLVPDPNVGHTP